MALVCDADEDARNRVIIDPKVPVHCFHLRIPNSVQLISETHNGETTVLVLRRRPRAALVD